jgi:hypothetical protein
MIPEFTLPTDWDDHNDPCSDHLMNMIINDDEEFSAASTEVSMMMYEHFHHPRPEGDINNNDDQNLMMMSLMQVDYEDDDEDEPLSSSNLQLLLQHHHQNHDTDDDEIFHDPCLPPPAGGMEYHLESISLDDQFALSLLEGDETASVDDSATTTSQQRDDRTTNNKKDPLFEERYKVMLDRLAESMRRSQETRKSLTIHTTKTKDYERRKSLSGVLSSVEKSTSAIQALLHTRLS